VVRARALDHLVLNCADVEASLRWYSEELGLEPVRVDEWRGGSAPFPSVRIDPQTIIDLFPAPRSGVPVDLDALAASGRFDVAGDGPVSGLFGARGYATSLYVRDPDGNTVELRTYD